ncbi:MAG: hypothetical protein AAGA25_08085 [Planctomycetota bacterium]
MTIQHDNPGDLQTSKQPGASRPFDANDFCRVCDYPLQNLTSDKCPECGAHVDADDPRTYWDAINESQMEAWAIRMFLFFLLPFLLLIIGLLSLFG